MEFIEGCLTSIHSEWRPKVRSLLVPECLVDPRCWDDSDFVGYGVVTNICHVFDDAHDIWNCNAVTNKPIDGLVEHPDLSFELWSPKGKVKLTKGTWFGFQKVQVLKEDEKIKIFSNLKSVLWIVSEHSPSLPCYFCHAFAGGFAGWERATKWVDHKKLITCAGSISIDFDFEAVETWKQWFGGNVYGHDIEIEPPQDRHFCVLSDVESPHWFNALKYHINVIMTISPPCQSWSRGGRSTGVESQNGLTFLQTILAIRLVRPVVVPTECADKTPQHDHYKILKLAFRLAGYKCVWSTISTFEDLSSNVRTRWLAVWVRLDALVNSPQDGFKLRDLNKVPWNHVLYDFPIPGQLQHQLSLSKDLLGIYGDVNLLPDIKRKFLTDQSQTAVLNSRCIKPGDCLPTLCASYTKQHELSKNHLSKKGIFGCLIQHELQFFFLDPLRFAALFGATTHAIVALPTKCEIAFHLLGNAVTVPQALVALCQALHIVGFSIPSIETLVDECWKHRLTTNNSTVLRNADFIFIVPLAFIVDVIPRCIRVELSTECICSFGGFEFACELRKCIRDVFRFVGFEDEAIDSFDILREQIKIDFNDLVINHCSSPLRLCKHGHEIAVLNFTPRDDGITPTVPFSIDITYHDHDSKNHDSLDELDCAILQSDKCLPSFEASVDFRVWIFLAGETTRKLELPINLIQDSDLHRNDEKLKEVIKQWIKPLVHDSNLSLSTASEHLINIGIFQTVNPIPGSHRSFVVVPGHSPTRDAFVLFQNHEDDFQLIAVPRHCRLAHPLRRLTRDFDLVFQNEIIIDAFAYTQVSDADILQCKCEPKRKHQNPRINLMFQNGPKLASDELQAISDWINSHGTGGVVHKFISWKSHVHSFCKTICDALSEDFASNKVHCFPILFDDHWGALEICVDTKISKAFNIPKDAQQILRDVCIRALAPIYAYTGLSLFVHPTWPDMCGWVVISRWIGNFNVPLPRCISSLNVDASIPFCGIDSHNPSIVIDRSIALRKWFISECSPDIDLQCVCFGGTLEDKDSPMQPSREETSPHKDAVDPWTRNDPWLVAKKQCRWEDLHLPDDHPFWYESKRIAQVHRTQISTKLGGIAFATKAVVNDVFLSKPPQETALIVPVSDKNNFDSSLKVSGPFEVIVKDNVVGTMYKRQIVLVQNHDLVTFQLPKATYSSTLTVLREVVLEFDERLISKDLVATILRNPLETFRAKAVEQFPGAAAKGLNVYAFRVIPVQQKSDNHRIFQAMCKLSESHRDAFLELSGTADLFARDFIPKGDSPQDHITIPKFWIPDKANKDDALRMASTLEGFAGLVLTKRGLAVRGWNTKVACLRRVLQAQDERVNEDNITVIPNIQLEATGWPSSISPSEVIKATKHALGLAPMLFRCYKARGVTSWSLGFDRRPKNLTFVAKFNDVDCEILLAEPSQKNIPDSKPKRSTGKAFGKGSSEPSRPPKQENIHQSDANSQRLTTLESKFAQMERRQDNLEGRISTGFETVNDQLRQVLNLIQPRPHSGPSSGFTPPPKAPRNS